jgi:abortive infection bacteriophage resistance protein
MSERYLPIWMATELISFGPLSQMYANLRKSLRKKIARAASRRRSSSAGYTR